MRELSLHPGMKVPGPTEGGWAQWREGWSGHGRTSCPGRTRELRLRKVYGDEWRRNPTTGWGRAALTGTRDGTGGCAERRETWVTMSLGGPRPGRLPVSLGRRRRAAPGPGPGPGPGDVWASSAGAGSVRVGDVGGGGGTDGGTRRRALATRAHFPVSLAAGRAGKRRRVGPSVAPLNRRPRYADLEV